MCSRPWIPSCSAYLSRQGDLYVSVGSDANIEQLKKKTMFPEDERVYMVGIYLALTHVS